MYRYKIKAENNFGWSVIAVWHVAARLINWNPISAQAPPPPFRCGRLFFLTLCPARRCHQPAEALVCAGRRDDYVLGLEFGVGFHCGNVGALAAGYGYPFGCVVVRSKEMPRNADELYATGIWSVAPPLGSVYAKVKKCDSCEWVMSVRR